MVFSGDIEDWSASRTLGIKSGELERWIQRREIGLVQPKPGHQSRARRLINMANSMWHWPIAADVVCSTYVSHQKRNNGCPCYVQNGWIDSAGLCKYRSSLNKKNK